MTRIIVSNRLSGTVRANGRAQGVDAAFPEGGTSTHVGPADGRATLRGADVRAGRALRAGVAG